MQETKKKTQGIKERLKKRSSGTRRKCKLENISKEGNKNENKKRK